MLSSPTLEPKPLVVISPLLSHARPAVRRRAIITLAQFVPITSEELFDALLRSNVLPALAPGANTERQQTTVQLIAAVARHSSNQLAPVPNEVLPGVLKAVHRDDDDLRESSLQVGMRRVLLFSADIDICSGDL